MGSQKKLYAVFLVVFLLIAGCGDSAEQRPQTSAGVSVGQLAPDFTLKSLTGEDVTLSSFRGKNPVFIIFWATWCPYCIKDIPSLKEIYGTYSPKGLKILAIDIGLNDPVMRVQAFQKQFDIPYTILYDATTSISRQYGVIGVPFNILIDRNGKVVYRSNSTPENLGKFVEKEKPV